MLKYVAVLSLPLMVCAAPATSQSRTIPGDALQVQKIAAEREAMNNATSSAPQQRLEHDQIARLIAERQAQLRLDTAKLVALTAELKQHVEPDRRQHPFDGCDQEGAGNPEAGQERSRQDEERILKRTFSRENHFAASRRISVQGG